MDKKNLFLVFLLSALFLGVNWYFESEHQKAVLAWTLEQGKLEQEKIEREQPGQEAHKSSPSASSSSSAPLASSHSSESPTTSQEEKFYLLENGFLQLLFSNHGGALAEVNLPFQSETHPDSVVKETDYDRMMITQEPQNSHFPSHPYIAYTKKELEADKIGGYYPLIRRDLIQKAPKTTERLPPKFYALNIVSEFPEVANQTYEVVEFTENSITFEAKNSVRKIRKKFTVEPNYCIVLDLKIEGDAKGLWLTSGIPEVEWISGAPAPSLKYRITQNEKSEVRPIDLPEKSTIISSIVPDWVVNSNGFLGVILDDIAGNIPGFRIDTISGSEAPSRLVEIDEQYNRFPRDKMPGYLVKLPLKATEEPLHFRVFLGPFDTKILEKVDKTYANPETGYNPDYIASQTFHGYFAFISEPFARFLWVLMDFFHTLTGSWALSILLLTIALRVMLYPLNAWSINASLKMQKIAPEVQKIQEKYKKDPKKAQMEIVALYREGGVNPLSGCLPLLIQMPFLIGMFDLLKSSFALRGASFIPGWIDDLSAPDILFSWSTPIPFIGNSFHLLPFLLGGVMFLQQRVSSPLPTDPATWSEQQRQQRTMGTVMTAVFTFMFYHFPSGLNLYWLFSMGLGILQQMWTSSLKKKDTSKKNA